MTVRDRNRCKVIASLVQTMALGNTMVVSEGKVETVRYGPSAAMKNNTCSEDHILGNFLLIF